MDQWLRNIPVLAQDRVLFVGEKVVAVASETVEAVEEACNLIDMVERLALQPCHVARPAVIPPGHPSGSTLYSCFLVLKPGF